jgi:hypothetical protein
MDLIITSRNPHSCQRLLQYQLNPYLKMYPCSSSSNILPGTLGKVQPSQNQITELKPLGVAAPDGLPGDAASQACTPASTLDAPAPTAGATRPAQEQSQGLALPCDRPPNPPPAKEGQESVPRRSGRRAAPRPAPVAVQRVPGRRRPGPLIFALLPQPHRRASAIGLAGPSLQAVILERVRPVTCAMCTGGPPPASPVGLLGVGGLGAAGPGGGLCHD